MQWAAFGWQCLLLWVGNFPFRQNLWARRGRPRPEIGSAAFSCRSSNSWALHRNDNANSPIAVKRVDAEGEVRVEMLDDRPWLRLLCATWARRVEMELREALARNSALGRLVW